MSDYTTKATAVLSVNGDQAKSEIPKLKKLVVDLEVAVNNAAKAGNKPLLKSLKKELKDARFQLKQFESAAQAAEYVMQHLDKATPKELRAALRQLKKELNDIERGSAAWNQHVEKIKRVQAELNQVNKQMKVHESLWSRFSKMMFQWGNAIMVLAGSLSGLKTSALRAVEAFAEMDQEMANVRKYTGMTKEQVEGLNEEFKKIDTRSSRQQLNKLAQEAGRLGLQSEEDVMGFVRAADKINVALDDLGEGATLTLSKLTNIFGDRERLGVEKSLLAVGSVINELSQNSTAAAPYLAEFASRLGGVGAQAHMTTQQIMGYGAVLDAYNQKVEASSTALSQVIVRLYRDPAKYAQVAGLDVKAFTDLLKNDANAALLQFLETLHSAGGMDVLSPMFADMGEKGARAIQALSTLATHIDEVKAQQAAANQAFEEAVSIDKEFNVQNNTVQASLDKAKKRFHEMAVELGEKLIPVMRYAITGSSAMMRALSMTVDFLVEYKGTIITLTSAIAAYTVAVKLSNAVNFTLLRTYTLKMTLLRGQVLLYKAVAVAMVETKAAVLALRTAYYYLTGNVVKMKSALADLQMLMTKSNPWGMAAAAVAALIALIVELIPKQNEFTKSMKETIATANGMNAEFQKEQHELDILWGKLKAAQKGTDEYKSVKDSILRQYGAYLNGLIDENGEITNLAAAYDRLTLAIRRSAQERGIAAAREKAEEAYYSETEKNLNKLQEALEKAGIKADVAAQMVAKVSQLIVSGRPVDKVTSDMLGFANGQGSVWNSIKAMFGGGEIKGIIKDLVGNKQTFQSTSRTFDAMQDAAHPLRNVATEDLTKQIKALNRKIEENNKRLGKGEEQLDIVTVVYKPGDDLGTEKWLKQSDAIKLRDQLKEELAYRNGTAGGAQTETTTSGPGYTGVTKSNKKSGHDHNTHEDKFKAEKEWREREEALNKIAYATGERNYREYTDRQLEIEKDFYAKQLQHTDIGETERLKILAQYQDVTSKMLQQSAAQSIEDEDKAYAERKAQEQQYYLEGLISAETYNGKLEKLEMEHLGRVADIRRAFAEAHPEDEKATEAYNKSLTAYRDALVKDQIKNQKAYEDRVKKHQGDLDEIWDKYFETDTEKRQEYYRKLRALIEEAYKREIEKEGYSAEEKLEIEKRYLKALEKLKEEEQKQRDLPSYLNKKKHESQTLGERVKGKILKPLVEMKGPDGNPLLSDDDLQAIDQTLDNVYSSFASMYDSLNSLWEAEEELKLAALEKRYDAEISMAEGNAYKIQQIERKKQKEEAKLKAEASKRQFAQQVISAIAQTATAAINAYSSAAAIPVVGHVLAPIAAAMATAAGLMQVAAIKKQQTASLAQGYSQGGFTPDGRPDQPVGVVHAGEWVASQKLLKNPQTRAAIEALDYAQRNNTMGRISAADVSRSITAPSIIAGAAGDGTMQRTMEAMVAVMARYGDTMSRLGERLDEPFVTVNTVEGDMGMKRAQDDYQKMMNNTLPKNKRK